MHNKIVQLYNNWLHVSGGRLLLSCGPKVMPLALNKSELLNGSRRQLWSDCGGSVVGFAVFSSNPLRHALQVPESGGLGRMLQ